MKLKNKILIISNLKLLLILFIFGINKKVLSSETNFVIATIDRSPITYFDLKHKAKLMHFLSSKNSDYKSLKKYYKLALENLISQKLLIKKATEFNKNILKLTQKDATKYILERYNNSTEIFERFLIKNNLSKSVFILKIQTDIIKKYLIGKMFEKEYDDYLKEIKNISNNKSNEIDLEQIIIRVDKENNKMINLIDNQINSLLTQGYSFKEITKILSKNSLIKVSGGRSGWQNKNNFKSNVFEKLFKFPEGKIIKEKFNDNLNYLRIISKRESGQLSNREQIIDFIKITYKNSEKNKINLKKFHKNNAKLSCQDIYTKLSELKVFDLNYQKVNLTNFSEKILSMIEKTKVKQFTNPIIFNKESIQFYICNKVNINKKTLPANVYNEKLLIEKVDVLTNKILKILKKDSVINIKFKINELN